MDIITNRTTHIFQVALDDCEVQVRLGNKTTEEQTKNWTALTAVFDCICHAGKQGNALRGHGDKKKSGNLWNLLLLVGWCNDDINTYLKSESMTKFLSPEIQNKMLKILAHTILWKLITTIKMESELFPALYAAGNTTTNRCVFSLIADETSNISNKEQVSICI